MKSLFFTVLTTFVSVNALATTSNVKYVASDYSAETQVCLEAANNGFSSAKNKARDLGLDYKGFEFITQCNGKSLFFFSKLPNETAQNIVDSTKIKTNYKFITVNKTEASKICVDAAAKGFHYAAQNYRNIKEITCNGKSIARFARRYKS